VKRIILLRLSVVLFGIGAALVLTPACKAQSEISPDHFDGTDSWAVAARPVHPQPLKQTAEKPLAQAKSQKVAQGSAFQLAAAREVTKPVNRDASAADRNRKPSSANSDKP
jgi:hypothetical protein